MQNPIKDIDRLSDMKEFSEQILEHLSIISEADFHQKSLIQYGLLKLLGNVGEAAYQISRAVKAEFTSIEWDKIVTAWHVYVHEYFKIDWTKIWRSLNTIDFQFIIDEMSRIIEILKKRFLVE